MLVMGLIYLPGSSRCLKLGNTLSIHLILNWVSLEKMLESTSNCWSKEWFRSTLPKYMNTVTNWRTVTLELFITNKKGPALAVELKKKYFNFEEKNILKKKYVGKKIILEKLFLVYVTPRVPMGSWKISQFGPAVWPVITNIYTNI